MNEHQAAAFGKAVGDVTRQRILRYCCCEARNVGAIAKYSQVKQPTATHHLTILEKANLVNRSQTGKTVFYSVNQDHIVSCCGQMLMKLAPDEEGTKAINRCC